MAIAAGRSHQSLLPRITRSLSSSAASLLPKPIVDLTDTHKLFGSAATGELMRSLAMMCVMAVGPAVDLGIAVMRSPAVMGNATVRAAVIAALRGTVYQQFCAGEGIEEAAATLQRMWKVGLRGILYYGLEDAADGGACDRNLAGFLQTVDLTAALPSSSIQQIVGKSSLISMANSSPVKISLGRNGTYVSVPGSVIEAAPMPMSFLFGQGVFNLQSLSGYPTPAEAQVTSHPQKRECKAHRVQKEKYIAPMEDKGSKKEKLKQMVKAQQSSFSTAQKERAPPQEEALSEQRKRKKTNKMKRGDRPQGIVDLSSEEELRQWLKTRNDNLDEDNCRSVSIHMIGAQGQRLIEEPLREDGGAVSGQENTDQGLKERDEQINMLNAKLEEAMKAIALLTQHVPQTEPGSSGQGHTTTGSQPDTQPGQGEEHQRTPGRATGTPPLVAEQQTPILPAQAIIDAMVNRAVTASLAAGQTGTVIRKGRPYPEEYESVPYPAGFSQPKFRMFDGTGNPRQHTAQYRASCGFLGGSQPLLLKLFVTSLTGIAFTWYSELPNDSVTTFDELEDLFIARFASAQRKINIGDLVREKRKTNESLPDYIIRWRNLSMQCEPQLPEKPSVDILLDNIEGPIAPHLRGFEITTFQVLLDKVTKMLPAMAKVMPSSKESQPLGKHRACIAQVTSQKGKQTAAMETSTKSSEEKHNKRYSFRRESTRKILDSMIRAGFELPKTKKSYEAGLINDPLFCPYHRYLGHVIEDCFVFKNIVEEKYRTGNISLSEKFLLPKASICTISHSLLGPSSVGKASICMVHHASGSGTGALSLHDRQGSEDGQDQILWKLLQQKDEEIAGLKTQIGGLIELLREMAVENEKLKGMIPPTDIVAKTKSKRKGKDVTTAVTPSKPTEKRDSNLHDKLNKKYSFTRESTGKIFRLMLKFDLPLPEPKRPNEVGLVDEPLYCPFHRCLGHAIENCYVFKDIVERKYQAGEITLQKKHLLPEMVNTKAMPELKNNVGTQPLMVPAGATATHQKIPVYLSDSESSDTEREICELTNITKGSKLLKQVLASKPRAHDSDSNVISHHYDDTNSGSRAYSSGQRLSFQE